MTRPQYKYTLVVGVDSGEITFSVNWTNQATPTTVAPTGSTKYTPPKTTPLWVIPVIIAGVVVVLGVVIAVILRFIRERPGNNANISDICM